MGAHGHVQNVGTCPPLEKETSGRNRSRQLSGQNCTSSCTGAQPQTPLGELTALARSPSCWGRGSQPLPKNPTPPRPFRLRLTICPPLEKNPANAYASTATVDMDLFVEESSLDRTVRG